MGLRLYELARDLGVSSQDLLDLCHRQGVQVSNRLSSLDEALEKSIRALVTQHGLPAAAPSAPKPVKPAPKPPATPPPPVRLAAPPPVRPITAPPIHPKSGAPRALPPRPLPPRPIPPVAKPPAAETPAAKAPAPEAPAKPTPAAAPKPAPPAPPKAEPPKVEHKPEVKAEPPKFGIVKPAPKVEPPRYGVVKPAPPKPLESTERVAKKRPEPTAAPARGPKLSKEELDVQKLASRLDRRTPGGAALDDRAVRIHRTRRDHRAPSLAEGDEGARVRVHRGRRELKPKFKVEPTEKKPAGKIVLNYPVTLRDFSAAIGVKGERIIKELLERFNIMATINQILPEEMVEILAIELGAEVEVRKQRSAEEELQAEVSTGEPVGPAVQRAPVVTFLGHVDHGKTSLLDAIRETNIVATESGGITQHMRAFRVDKGKHHVVFLDTPGHEAFTAMRARGAHVTDVAVLVIAADDGVMPQTDEAINHARAAGVPIVVAMNKIDKPEANIERVKRQLAERDLLPEDWGGRTVCVPVSAITRKGLDDLIEMLSLEAELLELRAHPESPARGVVLEASMAEGRGVVANALIQEGTLHKGDIVLCGAGSGRVRAIRDDKGNELPEAGPAMPVEVSGLSELPEAGDRLFVLNDPQKAREIAEQRRRRERAAALAERQHVTLETLYAHIEAGKTKELRVILKTDVQGTLEALRKAVEDLGTEEVRVRILHAAAGGISESDVLLADASDAVIIGFHVVPEERARSLAEERHVEVRLYQVIYQATDEIKAAIEGMLEPESRETVTGRLNVLKTFRVSRIGTVAGCVVADGTIHRNDRIRVVRDNIVIFDGQIETLRRVKDDIREAVQSSECGVKVARFDDVKEGDVLVGYQIEKIARRLSTVMAEERQKRAQRAAEAKAKAEAQAQAQAQAQSESPPGEKPDA